FEHALHLNPNYAEAHNALGVVLEALGRVDEATRAHREATRVRPAFAEAWGNLGIGLGEQGRGAEAVETLRHSLALAPNAAIGSTLLANLLYSADLTAEQLRDQHIAWAEVYTSPLAPAALPRKRHFPPLSSPTSAGSGRGAERIRVGYVFGEF